MIDYIGERITKASDIKLTQFEYQKHYNIECYDQDGNRYMFIELAPDATG